MDYISPTRLVDKNKEREFIYFKKTKKEKKERELSRVT
jgi:hypothetical protein